MRSASGEPCDEQREDSADPYERGEDRDPGVVIVVVGGEKSHCKVRRRESMVGRRRSILHVLYARPGGGAVGCQNTLRKAVTASPDTVIVI